MQHVPHDAQVPPCVRIFLLVTIARITEDGTPEMRQMRADLVCATGFGCTLHERIPVSDVPPYDAIARARRLPARIDHHLWTGRRVVSQEWSIDDS